ncbi:signal peptidase I [Robertmurraya massiliosenegalensis]|uniref:signal peptidase I SipW n=1 Tax=Robertmurraya TaxID=2837507 RepID=UPI0039A4B6C5
MKRVAKWASNLVTIVLFLIFVLVLFLVISSKASGGEPQIFGYQLKTVLSGSMEPGIKTGSIIAVKPGGDMTRFKEGDVITFQEERNILITHRVTEVINNGNQVMYRTKGDNNNAEDINPVLSNNVVAEYNGFTVPYIGYFIDFAKSKNGSVFLLILPGVLLLGYAFYTIWQTLRMIENKGVTTIADDEPIDVKQ